MITAENMDNGTNQISKKTLRIVSEMNKLAIESLAHCSKIQIQEQYHTVLQLLKKAEKIVLQQLHIDSKNIQINKITAITFNNLACYYKKTKKPKVALQYLKKALQIEVQILKDTFSCAQTHLNMCAILSYMGNHNEAADHANFCINNLNRQYQLIQPQSQKIALIQNTLVCAYYNLGIELQYMKLYKQSYDAFQTGLELCESSQYKKNMINTYKLCLKRLEMLIQQEKNSLYKKKEKLMEQREKGNYQFMRKNKRLSRQVNESNIISKRYLPILSYRKRVVTLSNQTPKRLIRKQNINLSQVFKSHQIIDNINND